MGGVCREGRVLSCILNGDLADEVDRFMTRVRLEDRRGDDEWSRSPCEGSSFSLWFLSICRRCLETPFGSSIFY